jgi:oligopeptide/dipeptide ABC transporter ATP-binding protein
MLSIKNLSIEFNTLSGIAKAVNHLTFDINPRETVALVGESGSGKSTAAHAILRLLPKQAKVSSGSILFDQRDLCAVSDHVMRHIRGNSISMIFQDPMVALNPVLTIGRQVTESLRLHQNLSRQKATTLAIEMLKQVGIPSPDKLMSQYPHNLSGGMLQRVVIAIALLCKPQMLVADEPTTALDVTVQSAVLDLINSMKKQFNMAVLLITHDFGVVSEIADHVVVMYAGEKVEEGSVTDIFFTPRHPYTQGLLESIHWDKTTDKFLPEMPGSVPSALALPKGCNFADRCPYAMERCHSETPGLITVGDRHSASCFLIKPGGTDE